MEKEIKKVIIKAVKTMSQTAVGIIGTGYVLSDINWQTVVSASILSGLVSVLMNLSELKVGE
ncbi:hypothetical protein SG586P1_00023 [Streptococcus phage SG586P1]|nr:hypothetical protein SG586P1_00023 [Streptococcus phage SG586P1]WAX18020.1 hypothetical protein SG586P3_00015 [Streptococcus phage SG586P3]